MFYVFPIKSPLSGYYQLIFDDTTIKFHGNCGNLHEFFLISTDKLGKNKDNGFAHLFYRQMVYNIKPSEAK